ncbi:hypothetical protein DFH07DRAFT_253208 [Mycena maculata]|uniref:Uncharacterized protein n=1 Tax=Mycena maculata TaxID=230809 RepID=A0AAD7HQN5_9AGAR|nr:hypothetical protein DFH07DRAFT_253208 [Mycena maculata]
MTLHGLRGLAKHCKALEDLTVTFDASTVPPLNHPETRISQTSLFRLHVGAGAITDPTAVARFISDLFPNLAEISTDWDGTTDLGKAWVQVGAMLSNVTSPSVHQ